MNWEKSKTIVIWLLVALNGYLLFVNTILHTSYNIKSEQEKNIIELLNKNGIGIYDEINIEYKPMAPINVIATDSDIDEEGYLKLFLDNPEITRKSYEIIATEDSKYMYLANGFVTLKIADEEDYFEFEGPLEDFVKAIDDCYENFVLDKKFKDGDKEIYEFREEFKGKKVYTNYVSLSVVENKICEIEGFYGKVTGTSGKARKIASIDMVLYTFMEDIKEYETSHIFITGVDLVYYQTHYSEYVSGNNEKVIPCYRIYIEGEKIPFIINAYENKVIM